MSNMEPEEKGKREEERAEKEDIAPEDAAAPEVMESAIAQGDTQQEPDRMNIPAATAVITNALETNNVETNAAQEIKAEPVLSTQDVPSIADHITQDAPPHPVRTEQSDVLVEWQMHQMSRRSFLWGAVAVAAALGGLRWLDSQKTSDGIVWPLRRALQFNEGLARGYFKDARLAPTFSRAQAQEPRANGDIGLPTDFDVDSWKLHVIGLTDTAKAKMAPIPIPAVVDSDDDTLLPTKQELAVALDMAAIMALPRVEMVTELKCIEGWSVVVQWAGARFADFVAAYAPKLENGALPQYVGIQTPDGKYFVGLDMASAMHPQTLLCYEMNGAPLSVDHGAPLRLVTPVKYGIKHIKRIGAIRFTNERPIDYWAVLGYDWYAGH